MRSCASDFFVGGGGAELRHQTASPHGISFRLRARSADAQERIPTVPFVWRDANMQSEWWLRGLKVDSFRLANMQFKT
jgi:hypothetical protein